MFVISVSQDFAVGTVFSTYELADTAATVMGLRQYEIRQVFTEGERVIFRDSETGVTELGTIKFTDHAENFYHVSLRDGTLMGARHTELTSAPIEANPTAARAESDNPESDESKTDDLRAALEATIKEYAEYDHPCDSDAGDLDKAHGSVSIHVLRELLARHS